jgi:hypothetical protein
MGIVYARRQSPLSAAFKLGGEPSYTDLLTCLELERDARILREKDRGTAERQMQGNQLHGNRVQENQAPEQQMQGH